MAAVELHEAGLLQVRRRRALARGDPAQVAGGDGELTVLAHRRRRLLELAVGTEEPVERRRSAREPADPAAEVPIATEASAVAAATVAGERTSHGRRRRRLRRRRRRRRLWPSR